MDGPTSTTRRARFGRIWRRARELLLAVPILMVGVTVVDILGRSRAARPSDLVGVGRGRRRDRALPGLPIQGLGAESRALAERLGKGGGGRTEERRRRRGAETMPRSAQPPRPEGARCP